MSLSRRELLKSTAGLAALAALSNVSRLSAQPASATLGAGAPSAGASQASALLTRPIPSTGERIPVVGIGTLGAGYQQPTPESRTAIREVLRQLPLLGGSVVDTAPAYGGSEALIGEHLADLGNRDRIFLATKVGADGREAGLAMIENSFRALRVQRFDLLQIHSLRDAATQYPTLVEMKRAGRTRYIGVTTSRRGTDAQLEAFMRANTLDFVQLSYAIDDRDPEKTLLPLAADRGMGVIVNLAFGRERLWGVVQGKPLPAWAAEIDCRTWAQFFLKYVLSHPAVTCVIPGVTKPEHLVDNLQAAQGRMPDAAMRTRMEQHMAAL